MKRYLLGVALALGLGISAAGASTLQEEHANALAFSAILDSQSGFFHSILAAAPNRHDQEVAAPQIAKGLADYWGVTNRAELLALLAKMEDGSGGQRAFYWEIYLKVINDPLGSPNELYMEYGPKNGPRVHVVSVYCLHPVGKALPISAWDFGRYISVCRMGYMAGWLTEDEAWARIMPVARMLQASFSSWSDYAFDYVMGREFWQPEQLGMMYDVREVVRQLQRPDGGLWSAVPFGSPLGKGPVFVDPLATSLLAGFVPRNWDYPNTSYDRSG